MLRLLCSCPSPTAGKLLGAFRSPHPAILTRGNHSVHTRRVLAGNFRRRQQIRTSKQSPARCAEFCKQGEAACGKASSEPCVSHFMVFQAIAQDEAVESLHVPARSDISTRFLLQAGRCASA
ncbi:uncharacterized protein O9250_007949 [Rhynochetos jubatus]